MNFKVDIQKIRLMVVFGVALCSLTHAQNPAEPIRCHESFAEKIYLQPDSKVYTNNKTIWFKAIVTNAIDHAPTRLSHILYVDLIGPDDNLTEHQLIKLENGTGSGFFKLSPSYAEGTYRIRAYTEWNNNFGQDFFFNESLQVFAEKENRKGDPIRQFTLIKQDNNQRAISALFFPKFIDRQHKKELTVFIIQDSIKDSITIQPDINHQYRIEYPVAGDSRFVTIQMQTRNKAFFSKTWSLDEAFIDLQFFPEGGQWVHGIASRIGFKALSVTGKGQQIEGRILDREGNLVTWFKSNALGMGSFRIEKPDTASTYHAEIGLKNDTTVLVQYALPPVLKTGYVLSVTDSQGMFVVDAFSTESLTDSVSIEVSCRGIVRAIDFGPMLRGRFQTSVVKEQLPEGILVFTLRKSQGQALAERLSFNELPSSRLLLSVTTDKKVYAPRDSVSVSLQAFGSDGQPATVNASLLVINNEQTGSLQDTRQNILSYFLLTSELKGEIEQPGYYFNDSVQHPKDLDDLMLTQGWRKYLFTHVIRTFNFFPEARLTVSGTVKGLLNHKKSQKGVELTLLTFGNKQMAETQITDSTGRFCFELDDEYRKNLNILIQSRNKKGKKYNYSINIDQKQIPTIIPGPAAIEKADSIAVRFVEKTRTHDLIENSFRLVDGDHLIEEVVVTSKRMTSERKKVTREYGEADVVVSGESIREKEQKWSYGLYSVLMYNNPDKLQIFRSKNGMLYAYVPGSEFTLVVIDGITVKNYEYQLIPNIPPSEVESFEIIGNAKNFTSVFMEAFPDVNPLGAPSSGSIIAIYTYGRKGIYNTDQTPGILRTSVPVFSAPCEFYSPRYNTPESRQSPQPDFRHPVFWQPELSTDSAGMANTHFYNSDNTGTIRIVIEALSDKGEIGYTTMTYEVKKTL